MGVTATSHHPTSPSLTCGETAENWNVVDSRTHARLSGEDPTVARLALDPEAGGIIAIQSLTDLLASCSGVLTDDAAREAGAHMGCDDDSEEGGVLKLAHASPSSEPMASSGPASLWITAPWSAGTMHFQRQPNGLDHHVVGQGNPGSPPHAHGNLSTKPKKKKYKSPANQARNYARDPTRTARQDRQLTTPTSDLGLQ